MRLTHTILTLMLGLSLIIWVALARKTEGNLRQQLHTVEDANSVLRETLGNLTVAITQRDKRIDELYSSCGTEQKEPDSLHIPIPRAVEPSQAHDSQSISMEYPPYHLW